MISQANHAKSNHLLAAPKPPPKGLCCCCGWPKEENPPVAGAEASEPKFALFDTLAKPPLVAPNVLLPLPPNAEVFPMGAGEPNVAAPVD